MSPYTYRPLEPETIDGNSRRFLPYNVSITLEELHAFHPLVPVLLQSGYVRWYRMSQPECAFAMLPGGGGPACAYDAAPVCPLHFILRFEDGTTLALQDVPYRTWRNGVPAIRFINCLRAEALGSMYEEFASAYRGALTTPFLPQSMLRLLACGFVGRPALAENLWRVGKRYERAKQRRCTIAADALRAQCSGHTNSQRRRGD